MSARRGPPSKRAPELADQKGGGEDVGLTLRGRCAESPLANAVYDGDGDTYQWLLRGGEAAALERHVAVRDWHWGSEAGAQRVGGASEF